MQKKKPFQEIEEQLANLDFSKEFADLEEQMKKADFSDLEKRLQEIDLDFLLQ